MLRQCHVSPSAPSRPGGRLRLLLLGLWLACLLSVAPAAAQDLAERDRWLAAIAASPFEAPLRVVSEARSNSVSGSVYARLNQPFTALAAELGRAEAWCEILFLHLNVEACRLPAGKGSTALQIHVGRKGYQSLEAAERLDLQLRVLASRPDHLVVGLSGDRGPYSTRAFRLRLEAMPHGDRESLVHLRYSLAFGTPARVAMWAYFNVAGRDRVGFTVEERAADGTPRYVGGVRGMIERNVMRFYLALEVHLDTLALPAAGRFGARLRRWFAATERYPRQLHELDEATYLTQKRREHARQETVQ